MMTLDRDAASPSVNKQYSTNESMGQRNNIKRSRLNYFFFSIALTISGAWGAQLNPGSCSGSEHQSLLEHLSGSNDLSDVPTDADDRHAPNSAARLKDQTEDGILKRARKRGFKAYVLEPSASARPDRSRTAAPLLLPVTSKSRRSLGKTTLSKPPLPRKDRSMVMNYACVKNGSQTARPAVEDRGVKSKRITQRAHSLPDPADPYCALGDPREAFFFEGRIPDVHPEIDGLETGSAAFFTNPYDPLVNMIRTKQYQPHPLDRYAGVNLSRRPF
eukprot:Blabericola_migrator_1__9250@NODE_496_length_8026_cov_206_953889_g380_i0_p3_GENE_NODE_496_length_8026_cov_206_953889_g380_i0NODE_496_length_8026_cov_206_953889_g380_i0_p3_ORF_typecomplete_len274_score23_01_NODE_496_length_8026_cov_206_953889_g380_i033294150